MVLLQTVFAGSAISVTRCADSSQAIVELHKSGWKYDWVILESRGELKLGGKVASAVEALGLPVPVAFLDGAQGVKPALSLICGARESADRSQFLRCALSRPGAVKIDYRSHEGAEVFLEYRATCRKGEASSIPVLIIHSPAAAPLPDKLNSS